MARSWRSQIADEVRACSMMAPRDRKKVSKVLCGKTAVCVECGWEAWGGRCEAEAKQHARETGHAPTLQVSYDIHVDGS